MSEGVREREDKIETIYIYILLRCNFEQPDALQHNGMTNSEMEI